MKKLAPILLFLLALSPLSAQNLVFNGSFEIYQNCPKNQSQIKLAGGWDRATDGTPDYFNECSGTSIIGFPNNFMGSQKPRSGSAYAGIYLYASDAPDGYREYIFTELKTPLEKGKVYYVKFYVYLAKLSECAVGNIGVLFSEEVTKIGNPARIEQKPQLDYSGKIISDSGKWVEMLWTYKANGTEKFMTIGNFDAADKCAVKDLVPQVKDVPRKAYYYIDDVCVEEVKDGQPCRCIQDTNSFLQHAGKMKITRDSSSPAPGPSPPLKIKPDKTIVLENVLFEPEKSQLLPLSYKELDELTDYMLKNRYAYTEFDGYTDNTGIDKVNLLLSTERAKAVADYLIEHGIPKNRVRFKGYGSADPVLNNIRPEGQEKNRRVQFKNHIDTGKHIEITYKSQKLKDGYTLAFRRRDSINYLCLMKDGYEVEVSEHETDPTMPLDRLGYCYADFDSTVVIATHLEANPIKIEILTTLTGNNMMYGTTPFYMDTVRNLMMFEGSYRRGGKLILYNFNTGKSELFVAPRETPCFCCFCWKVLSLTDSEIKIEYLDMNYQKALKIYERK